uniref:Uncharacterized protein n=1 Tax=Arundo donax TaxID=35708 RepID=A0A0A8ZTA3_ARUDO
MEIFRSCNLQPFDLCRY